MNNPYEGGTVQSDIWRTLRNMSLTKLSDPLNKEDCQHLEWILSNTKNIPAVVKAVGNFVSNLQREAREDGYIEAQNNFSRELDSKLGGLKSLLGLD